MNCHWLAVALFTVAVSGCQKADQAEAPTGFSSGTNNTKGSTKKKTTKSGLEVSTNADGTVTIKKDGKEKELEDLSDSDKDEVEKQIEQIELENTEVVAAGALPVFIGDGVEGENPKKGAVPAPARGDAKKGKFLHASGKWKSPFPAGMIKILAGDKVPDGWAECDGREVKREDNKELFAAIATKWGSGDGTTTFNIPDLRGRFLRGWDHGAGLDPDAAARTEIKPGGAVGDSVGSAQAPGVKMPALTVTVAEGGLATPTIAVPAASGTGGTVSVQTPLTGTQPFNGTVNVTVLNNGTCTNLAGTPFTGNWIAPGNSTVSVATPPTSTGTPTTVATTHTHTATVTATDDPETRVINAAVLYIIKL